MFSKARQISVRDLLLSPVSACYFYSSPVVQGPTSRQLDDAAIRFGIDAAVDCRIVPSPLSVGMKERVVEVEGHKVFVSTIIVRLAGVPVRIGERFTGSPFEITFS